MRVTRAALLALVVAIAVLTVAFTGEDAAGSCRGSVRCTARRLPAPVTITAGRLAYRIARDGRASRTSPPRSPYPHDATWFPGTDTWYRIEHTTSRRRARFQAPVALASGHRRQPDRPHSVRPEGSRRFSTTISSTSRARRRRAAGRIRELPLGWTTGGLYTYSYPRRELLLRSDTGTLLKTISRRPVEYQFDLTTRSLYFLSHGVLIGAHGTHVWRLASLHSLGMSTNTSLQPLGRLIELLDDQRLALVRPDGSLFASTPIGQLDRISSSIATAPDASAVAFTALTGPTRHPNAENVYLLRAGTHAARVVHHQPGSFGGCAQWASVTWHARWLLYSDNDGKLAVMDTAGGHRTIDLDGLARHLLKPHEQFDARWSR